MALKRSSLGNWEETPFGEKDSLNRFGALLSLFSQHLEDWAEEAMRTHTQRLLLAGLIPAALVAAMAGCGGPPKKSTAPAAPPVVTAEVLTVGAATAPQTYTVTGTVKSLYNATLSSKVMGRVVAVNVREGDAIRLGQSLVTIDGRELQSAVNMADADYHAAVVGVGSARTAANMEAKASEARIAQAEAQVKQAEAAVAAAEARRDLAQAGPRSQEVQQSRIAVLQAESNLKLARIELDRVTKLVEDGAMARRELDVAQNRYDLAKGQYDAAAQAESIAKEGTRSQEIRAAQEGVAQAKAALKQAQSGVLQARAAALQVDMRRKDVEVANARTQQAAAAAQSARVGLSYGQVLAPFDGRVVARTVDPGAMASPGVPLLMVEGGEYRFEAVVPESLLGGLSKGDTARIKVGALGERAFTGRIVEIVPQGDATSHSFIVKFSLGQAAGIRSGMFGKAAIESGSTQRILIPTDATWLREGLHYVFALNAEGIARLRIVTLGEPTNGHVEVLSGLSKGDRVVVGDRAQITDGTKVGEK